MVDYRRAARGLQRRERPACHTERAPTQLRDPTWEMVGVTDQVERTACLRTEKSGIGPLETAIHCAAVLNASCASEPVKMAHLAMPANRRRIARASDRV